MKPVFIRAVVFLSVCLLGHAVSRAQLYIPYKDKPVKYQSSTLPAEKTGDGKLKGLSNFLQGTYMHYNYLFNANNRLNTLLNDARKVHRDDYTHLLGFDDYDPSALVHNSYLDTVIHKSTAALVLHDPRQKWTDEVYLLLGKAYYFKQLYDTAAFHFQFLNYAFAPKDDGFDIPVGSNISNKSQELTVSSPKEKWPQHHPRRNEGLIWLARTLIAEKQYTVAGGILTMLQTDRHFPAELQNMLNDCVARLYYETRVYDSAAVYLEKSGKITSDVFSRSRRSFLAGQLYQLAGDSARAAQAYGYAAGHTNDLTMSIYAALNQSALDTVNDENNTPYRTLSRLAGKNRFRSQQNLLYYLMANDRLAAKDTTEAINLFQKSIASSQPGDRFKNRSFKTLGDIAAQRQNYRLMTAMYDSTGLPLSDIPEENAGFQQIKQQSAQLETYLKNIDKEDSLQRLAAMPDKERMAYLHKELRRIRKRLGLKESLDNPVMNPAIQATTASDLFAGATDSKGEWYFNNLSLKSTGYQLFLQKFGRRPNVDNWIRLSVINNQPNTPTGNVPDQTGVPQIDSAFLTVQDLEANLPIQEDQKRRSDESIQNSYLSAGILMQEKLADFPAAVYFYQGSLDRYPHQPSAAELYFRLATCYRLMGQNTLADRLEAALPQVDSSRKYLTQLQNRKQQPVTETSESNKSTKAYADIYNNFIEGNFEEAEQAKKAADSLYGSSYWTPQLLFIESVYHISQRADSSAIAELKQLKQQFPASPMAERATTMIDVLQRRKEIESYLTQLQITKAEDSTETYVLDNPQMTQQDAARRIVGTDSTLTKKPITAAPTAVIQNAGNPMIIQKSAGNAYQFNPNDKQFVAIILDKVANVFARETGNAFDRYNRQAFYNQTIPFKVTQLDERYQLVLLGPFADASLAYNYIDKVKPVAPTRILPWLTADKFSFILISESNLELLETEKTLDAYKKILHQALPEKF